MDVIDLNEFRSDGSELSSKSKSIERFTRPIPDWWARRAMAVSPKGKTAFAVGFLLWRAYGLTRNTQVRLPGSVLKEFHLHRDTVRTCLVALERAGLIAVKRFTYRSPLITLIVAQSR